MKICLRCNLQFDDNANFCGQCGGKLQNIPPEQIFCPKCGNATKPESDFCPKCGWNIKKGKKSNIKHGVKNNAKKSFAKNKRTWAVALVIVILVIFLLFVPQIFVNPADKILLGMKNTMSESSLMNDLSKLKILNEDNYTLSFEGNTTDGEISLKYIVDDLKRQLITEAGNGGWTASLLEDEMQIVMPDNRMIVYPYRENPDNALADVFGEEVMEKANIRLQRLYDEKEIKKRQKEIILDKMRSLDFEDNVTRYFNINGKRRACKGYSTSISAKDIKDIYYDISDMLNEELDIQNSSVLMSWQDIEEIMSITDDYKVRAEFYLYKKKLVGLKIRGKKINIDARMGCENPGLNDMKITVINDYETMDMDISGQNNDEEECYDINIEDERILSLCYNDKIKEFNLTYCEDYSDIEAKIYIKPEITGISFEIADVKKTGESVFDGIINLKRGGKLEEASGDEVDINEYFEETGLFGYKEGYKDIQSANMIATAVQTALSQEETYDEAMQHYEWATDPIEVKAGNLGGGVFEQEVMSVIGGEIPTVKARILKNGKRVDGDSFWLRLDAAANIVEVYIKTKPDSFKLDESLSDFIMLYPTIDEMYAE